MKKHIHNFQFVGGVYGKEKGLFEFVCGEMFGNGYYCGARVHVYYGDEKGDLVTPKEDVFVVKIPNIYKDLKKKK